MRGASHAREAHDESTPAVSKREEPDSGTVPTAGGTVLMDCCVALFRALQVGR